MSIFIYVLRTVFFEGAAVNKHNIKHHIYFILNTAKYKEYLGQTH